MSGFFVAFVLSEASFLNIRVLSQCASVLNKLYPKTLLHIFFCLFFKIVESLQFILSLSHLSERILSQELSENFWRKSYRNFVLLNIKFYLLAVNQTSTKNCNIPEYYNRNCKFDWSRQLILGIKHTRYQIFCL